jgi:hypothetical protein
MTSTIRKIRKGFQTIVGVLFCLIERMKGNKTVYEIRHPKYNLGSLTGYSVSGYELNIHCQLKEYRRSYDKWFIPDEFHMVYHVYSTVSNDAPELLKSVCGFDIDFPALLPNGSSIDNQRKAAVDAYLDILIQKLSSEKSLILVTPKQ